MTQTLRSPRGRLVTLAALLAMAATAAAFAGPPSADALESAFANRGFFGAAAFAALYAVLTVALVPGAALTIAAGVLYGPVGGTMVSVVGATAGATAAFALSRRASRGAVESLEGRRLQSIEQRLREHGMLAMIALRLVPLVPFNVLNYAAGASALRARDYVAGTAIGIVPGAVAYATVGGSFDEPGSPAFIAGASLAVLLTLAGVIIARRQRPAPTEARERPSLAPHLRRLAWSAALLFVVGALLAIGLSH